MDVYTVYGLSPYNPMKFTMFHSSRSRLPCLVQDFAITITVDKILDLPRLHPNLQDRGKRGLKAWMRGLPFALTNTNVERCGSQASDIAGIINISKYI